MTVPPPAYGPASPYPSESAYQAPPKKRGLKRIIFGALGIVANLIGLVVMPLVAAVIVAVVVVTNVDATSLGSESGSVKASGMSMYYVYVPTEEADAATCSVSGGDTSMDSTSGEGMTSTVDGASYTAVGTFNVSGDQTVQVSCEGASDVAVADVGMTGVLIAAGVGFGIPILLGIIALILLIWGIVARVRSSRQIREHMQQHQQFQGYQQH
ncbi:hypothetical protein [Brachybacterium kimchii]|uniref:Uncharacterized protein n=1 Tax=Brachybacterium kimchii TaxID=2942909 RepID=A0ABY4N6H8_9MICO|nr:hypothetical protein [Brachybacterium kimchii]UQN29686.1 hypothetical protein M4486_18975 [Brachybacterium kimchii]